jgi:hypothetical protein
MIIRSEFLVHPPVSSDICVLMTTHVGRAANSPSFSVAEEKAASSSEAAAASIEFAFSELVCDMLMSSEVSLATTNLCDYAGYQCFVKAAPSQLLFEQTDKDPLRRVCGSDSINR